LETALRVVFSALYGLAFGSFVTVVVDRVPKGESVLAPRSRCPSCGCPIRGRDNVPVLSYVVLGGRCRCCHSRIPLRYPLIELVTASLFVAVTLVHASIYADVVLCAFCAVMVAIAAIDAERQVIPNRITYPAIPAFAAGIALGWLLGAPFDPLRALAGMLAYAGGFLLIAVVVPQGLGMGDVKLAALIGLVTGSLGLGSVGVAAGLGVVFGGVAALIALIVGVGRKQRMPFGPFLAAGGVAAVLAGPQLADAYLRVFR
jgi:leader peptidase (prepilin peptidase) / N-methyltransferase